MITGHMQPVSGDPVEQPLAGSGRHLAVHVEGWPPIRIAHEKGRIVGHVTQHHQTFGTRCDLEDRMSRRMTMGWNGGDPRNNLPLARKPHDRSRDRAKYPHRVLKERLGRLRRAAGCRLIEPVIQLAFRRVDGRIGKQQLSGRGSQAGNVIRMEMRNENGIDLGRINAGGGKPLRQPAGIRTEEPGRPGIDRNQMPSRIDHKRRERDRKTIFRLERLGQGRPHGVQTGIGDKPFDRAGKPAVLDRRHGEIPDKVSIDAGIDQACLRGRLRRHATGWKSDGECGQVLLASDGRVGS